MNRTELKFFTLDNAHAPRPWKLSGGFHMRTERTSASSGYRIVAEDGTLVAHTEVSGDVFWGGHAEARRLIAEGVAE